MSILATARKNFSASVFSLPPKDGSTRSGSLENVDPEIILSPRGGSGIVDVINKFIWTASPLTPGARAEIPRVLLTERKIEMNSVAGGALYYLTGGAKIKNVVTDDGLGLGTAVNALNKVKDYFGDKVQTSSDQGLLAGNESYLKSYLGMFSTAETGWKYMLPHFTDSSFTAKNNFSSNVQTQSTVSQLVGEGQAGFSEAANVFNITQPGTYIERPKHFHFPEAGKSITVKFPLINTILKQGVQLPYKMNYELLWILAFQNRPFRTSFSRILPPKIYTLTIPGQDFMPYSYISDMRVDFIGTRRLMDVNVPSGGTTRAPIPEAYNVSITFTSLISDVGNTMVSAGFRNRVNTGVA